VRDVEHSDAQFMLILLDVMGPQVSIIGCLFHWKQAIRRKLAKMKFGDDLTAKLMRPDMLEVLTLIPHDEVISSGFQYIYHRLQPDHVGRTQLDEFFQYFRNTWIKKFSVKDWNISRFLDTGNELANRTNNPLEKYNRVLNELFPHPHPSLKDFVVKLRCEAERVFQEYQNVQSGLARPPVHSQMNLYSEWSIPNAYRAFRQQEQDEAGKYHEPDEIGEFAPIVLPTNDNF